MSDAGPSTSTTKASKSQEPRESKPAFKPAKFTLNDKQVVDYVRTATAKNIWYYRYATLTLTPHETTFLRIPSPRSHDRFIPVSFPSHTLSLSLKQTETDSTPPAVHAHSRFSAKPGSMASLTKTRWCGGKASQIGCQCATYVPWYLRSAL